jgi:hypothetical protein
MKQWIAALGSIAMLVGCAGNDPVHTRCIEERKTYCQRLFACVQLGGLTVTVNYENESKCTTEESKKCETVTEANACPGGSSSSYSAAKHDQCIADQRDQSCASFANRPSSCSTYCCTATDAGTC